MKIAQRQLFVVRKAKQDLQDLQDEQDEKSKVDIGNADIGLRRETLMNQTTYPFALRQDKKSFSTFLVISNDCGKNYLV